MDSKRIRAFVWGLLAVILLVSLPLAVLAQDATWEITLGDIVYGTALSEDGSVKVVGSRNNYAAAYDQQGNLLWEFAPGGTVWGVDTSADGQWTAVASEDRNIYLLNAGGEQMWAYRGSRIFLDVAISGDGSRIAAVDESRQLFYFDRESNEPLWAYNQENISDSVAIYGSNTIRTLTGTRDSIVSLFSPDGDRLWRSQLADDVTGIAVTNNGAQVVAATLDGRVTLINGANSNVIWQMTPPDQGRCTSRSNCLTVDIAGDGSHVLVGSRSGEVFLLDSADGSILQRSNVGAPVSSVALSGDGQNWLIGTRGGEVIATTTEVMGEIYAAAQTLRRNLAIGIPAALLILVALGAVWVRRTASGAHFWNVTSRPVRQTLIRMWRSRISYFLIAPTILLLLIFNYYPAASGLYHSFTEWTPGVDTVWVGFAQFEKMADSNYFWIGMKNAVLLAVAAFAKLTIPLLVAELIFHIRSNFMQYAVRTLFIIPLVVPSVVGVLLWVNIYDPNIGLLNESLRSLGLNDLTRTWLGDRSTAMSAIIAIGFPWISPFALLIFYGGLITIPQELFDAAKVDGATWWHRFTQIDIPMIMSQIKLLVILAFIGSLQEFQLIFLTTGGGPGNVTYTPALELYYNATRFNNYGLASAMGTFLFLMIMGGTIINLRYVRSQTEYEA